MQDTYSHRGVEIREYATFASRDLLGFRVTLCEFGGRPFILASAKSWTGDRQPRFVSVPKLDEDFPQTLADLSALGAQKQRGTVRLGAEDSIWIESGLLAKDSLDESVLAAWNAVAEIR